MMRVSHNPPSFFPPCVLVLLPAPAGAARAFSWAPSLRPAFRRGGRELGNWQDQALHLMQSYDPEGAHTQICSVTHNKQLRFTYREGDEHFEQMMH